MTVTTVFYLCKMLAGPGQYEKKSDFEKTLVMRGIA